MKKLHTLSRKAAQSFTLHLPTFCVLTLVLIGAHELDRASHAIYGSLTALFVFIFLAKYPLITKRKWGLDDLALLGFGLTLLLSFFFRQSLEGDQELMGLGAGILIYFILSHLKKSPLTNKSLSSLLVLGSIFSIYGIYDFITGPSSRLSSIFYGEQIYHTYPNAMAAFLLMMIPLHLWLSPSLKNKKSLFKIRSLLWASSLLIHLTAFWLTFSRASALALLATAAILFILKGLKPLKILLPAVLLSLLLAFFFNTLNPYSLDPIERFQGEEISGAQSVNERFEFWEGALEITKDNPWLGVGPGSFEYIYPEYQNELLVLSDHPHNIFLKISSENGIPAALLFLLFLSVLAFKNGHHLNKSKPLKKQQQIALGGLVMALMAQSMMDYNLNFTLVSFIFFSSLGLLKQGSLAKPSKASKNSESSFYHPFSELQAFTLFTLFLLVPLGSFLRGAQGLYREFTPLAPNPQESLEKYPNIFSTYFECSVADYQSGKSQSSHIKTLLEKNSLNELSFHWLYLLDESQSPNFDVQERSIYYSELLSEYQKALVVNMHQTAVSSNAEAADQIFNWFISNIDEKENTENVEILNKWTSQRAQFTELWQLELDKFNERFGSDFTRETHDHVFESLLIKNTDAPVCKNN
jgi:O-antigen ligase